MLFQACNSCVVSFLVAIINQLVYNDIKRSQFHCCLERILAFKKSPDTQKFFQELGCFGGSFLRTNEVKNEFAYFKFKRCLRPTISTNTTRNAQNYHLSPQFHRICIYISYHTNSHFGDPNGLKTPFQKKTCIIFLSWHFITASAVEKDAFLVSFESIPVVAGCNRCEIQMYLLIQIDIIFKDMCLKCIYMYIYI